MSTIAHKRECVAPLTKWLWPSTAKFLQQTQNALVYGEHEPRNDQVIVPGSDEEIDETHRAAKRRRIEVRASQYLSGHALLIQSASLRDPSDSCWENPWMAAQEGPKKVEGRHERLRQEVVAERAKVEADQRAESRARDGHTAAQPQREVQAGMPDCKPQISVQRGGTSSEEQRTTATRKKQRGVTMRTMVEEAADMHRDFLGGGQATSVDLLKDEHHPKTPPNDSCHGGPFKSLIPAHAHLKAHQWLSRQTVPISTQARSPGGMSEAVQTVSITPSKPPKNLAEARAIGPSTRSCSSSRHTSVGSTKTALSKTRPSSSHSSDSPVPQEALKTFGNSHESYTARQPLIPKHPSGFTPINSCYGSANVLTGSALLGSEMQKPSQRCDTASAKQNKPDHKATPGNGRFSGKENDLEIGDRRILAAAVTSRHLIVEVERSSQQRAASSAVKRSAAIESARETGKFQDTLGEVLIRTANDEPTFSVWEAVQQSAERCSRLTLEPLSKSAKSRKRQKSVKTRKQNFVSIVYENPPEASKQLAPPAETMHRQLQNWPTSTSSPFLYRKNPAGGQNLETSQPWARPFKHRPRLMTSESSPAILAPLVSVPLSSKTSRIIVTEQADGANFPAIEMSFGSNGSFGHGWGLIGQYTNSIVPLANATSGNAESVRQDLREDMQLSGEVDSCSPSPGKLCDIRETTMKCLTSDQAMRSDEKTAAPKHSSVDIHTSPFVIFNTQAAIHDAQLALVEDLTSPVKKALSPVPVQRLSLSRQAQDTVAKTITPFHELNSSISREIREEQYDIPLPSTQALFDAASPFFASTVKKPIAGRASGLEKTQDKVSRYTTRERNAVSSESPTMIDDTSNRLEAVGSNETIESYCNPTTEPGLEPGRGSSPFNRYNEAFLSTHLSDGNASVTPLAETSKIKPDSSWLHTGLDTREKSQTRTNKPTARPAGDISSAQATTIAFSQHGKRIETWSAMLDSSLQQRIHDQ